MGPAARSPVADAASGSGLFGLHSTQGRPNKEYVDLRVSGWEALRRRGFIGGLLDHEETLAVGWTRHRSDGHARLRSHMAHRRLSLGCPRSTRHREA